MDTTTAAQQAGVTVPTIRVWARMGAIRAVKVARRWVIDAASLAYRISLGIRRTTKETAVQHLSRADYEAAARQAGRKPAPDNHLHGSLELGHYDGDLAGLKLAEYQRALAVAAEKEAGTWSAPAKKKTTTCYYCGVPITRHDGECEDCGSQIAVAKWLA